MARSNDEIDASLIRMQDSIARHVKELGTAIQAQGERHDKDIQELRNSLTTRMVDVATKAEKLRVCLAKNLGNRIQAEGERVDKDLQVLDAQLRHHFDLLEVKQSEALEALGDKCTAEIAALSGRIDLSCAGC